MNQNNQRELNDVRYRHRNNQKTQFETPEEKLRRKENNKKNRIIAAKIFLTITAGLMDAYGKGLCALLFWDKRFLEGDWLLPAIWKYEKDKPLITKNLFNHVK